MNAKIKLMGRRCRATCASRPLWHARDSELATVTGQFARDYARWALADTSYAELGMRPEVPDPADWSNSDVGWGIILPEKEGLPDDQLARADDAPEPIRALVAEREGKVLRYSRESTYGNHFLRDYKHET